MCDINKLVLPNYIYDTFKIYISHFEKKNSVKISNNHICQQTAEGCKYYKNSIYTQRFIPNTY